MSNTILGISAFYHDSAAALVRDGVIVAAAQEERFSRKKHDPRFPVNAINYCLEEGFVDAADLDAVIFYDNPLATFDRVVENALAAGEEGRDQFVKAAGQILGDKMWVNEHVRRAMGSLGREGQVLFAEHHMAHAASAFYPSPFERAAILTIDGVGEWATTSLGAGDGKEIRLFSEINYPHSLGLLYSAFTYFCGFKVNSGEYKLMGLAPYGEPRYYDAIRDHLIDVRDDGSYRLDTSYFGYLSGMVMTGERFADAVRRPGAPARVADHAARDGPGRQRPEADRGNHAAHRAPPALDHRRIEPGDGRRRGAQLRGQRQAGGRGHLRQRLDPAGRGRRRRCAGRRAAGRARLLRPAARGARRRQGRAAGQLPGAGVFQQRGAGLRQPPRLSAHARSPTRPSGWRSVAGALAEGKIVGWFSGRMEFGPRSLGARSILGDPRSPTTQETMNLKIKYRESFRPFAPSVLRERCAEYFELDCDSPYMLLIAPLREERRIAMDRVHFDDGNDDMLAVINQARSDVPAITHVDYSARVQTVDAATNPEYHALIRAFEALTGCGMLVNTSFNVRGEPIVCTPGRCVPLFRAHRDGPAGAGRRDPVAP